MYKQNAFGFSAKFLGPDPILCFVRFMVMVRNVDSIVYLELGTIFTKIYVVPT